MSEVTHAGLASPSNVRGTCGEVWNAQGMGQWLQNYSGALAAGASIVLVVVTAIYVRLTSNMSKDAREQVTELRKTRLDAQMPVVAISTVARSGGKGSRLVFDVEIHNIGAMIPADVAILFPLDWKTIVGGMADSVEPGWINFTVNPGGRANCSLTAEADKQRANSADRESFDIEFEVSQQGAGATDYFTWMALYDHKSEALVEIRRTALHERRKYPKLDLDDQLESWSAQAAEKRWIRLFKRR